jgi:hypothetical protein
LKFQIGEQTNNNNVNRRFAEANLKSRGVSRRNINLVGQISCLSNRLEACSTKTVKAERGNDETKEREDSYG